jgi:hypothetical protein
MTLPGNLPVVVIACKVFQDLVEHHLPERLAGKITFLDYGLHRVPNNLRWSIQEAIDSVDEPSLIVLAYGLCGNGLHGIKAGEHTLLIPRADDCIAILLGSYKEYIREFEDHPGTYYLTKGWLESGSDPLKEYHQAVEKYGEESAAWIMDQQYQHYRRIVLVAHNQEDLDKYRSRAMEVAEYCKRWGMTYEERLGSEDYLKGLAALIPYASGEMAGLEETLKKDFIVISPGGELSQDKFFR